jgi:hypothetical protein
MSEQHECPNCDQEIPNDIWRDPGVKAALKSGRSAIDIMVLACPACARFGYYNQGSSFWCRFCQRGWQCLSEGEESDGGDCLYLDGMDSPMTLADTETDTTDGYYNETRKSK